MNKIHYIFFLIFGALLVFSSLPIVNYMTDKWRVLHEDYNKSYRGISPNKTFLKVVYLLDNPKKYKTILMGSSRSGYMDSRLISNNAYNMKFNFALAKMHLHNLKILLKNNVKIKNLWIGINDYIIWKNPDDHKLDYQRRLYQDSWFQQLDMYSFYLLKQIDARDLKILQGKKYHLHASEEITYPDKANMKTANAREKYAVGHPKIWIEKMTKISPTLLGYRDDNYRIDEAVGEIQEIKKLCDEHNISLTVFMYPSYYKTYLSFNQRKIELFKKKLVSVIDFHDFYKLDIISLNELHWQDSSHFHASIGRYIIQSIKKNKFLVTKQNILEHLESNTKMIKNILHKKLFIPYIYKFNTHIDLNSLHRFVVENKKLSITGVLLLNLNENIYESENIIMHCEIESKVETHLRIYYKKENTDKYNEQDKFLLKIHKGINKFNLLVPSIYISQHIKMDFINKKSNYIIKNIYIYD